MLRFLLPNSIALVASVVISLITFHFTLTKEGKIHLPVTTSEQNEGDIFDVIRPENVTDGYPIDEESFWTWVCWDASILQIMVWFWLTRCDGGKLFCHCFLLMLWWSLWYHRGGLLPPTTMMIWKPTLVVYFLLAMSLPSQHVLSSKSWHMIIQLRFYTSLGCWLSHFCFWVQLQYCHALGWQSWWQYPLTTSSFSWACSMHFSAYTLFGCILVYSTPLGLPLHYPPSDIYSKKTMKSIANMDQQNICGTTGRHILCLKL